MLRFCAAASLFFASAASANATEAAPYASDDPMPAATVFAPGVVSGGDFDSHPAFTPDGKTLYFVRSAPNFRFWAILESQYRNGHWSEPAVAPFSGRYSDADPFITPDGQEFFFISKRPVDGQAREDTEIWTMHRTDTGWSEPSHLAAPISSAADEWYPTVASDGTLYFGSERKGGLGASDLYRARKARDRYESPENLGPAINTEHDEYEPYILPDQSALVFMACARKDSLGQCDLYLSRRAGTDWSTPSNLGAAINSDGMEYSPKLSPDGRYFFWTSARNAFTHAPLPQRLGYGDLMRTLRSAGNGLGDIFEIDAQAIGLGKPASRP